MSSALLLILICAAFRITAADDYPACMTSATAALLRNFPQK